MRNLLNGVLRADRLALEAARAALEVHPGLCSRSLAKYGCHRTALQDRARLAVGAPLSAQGLIALIGRDVLSAGTLHYNGVVGEFTLAV